MEYNGKLSGYQHSDKHMSTTVCESLRVWMQHVLLSLSHGIYSMMIFFLYDFRLLLYQQCLLRKLACASMWTTFAKSVAKGSYSEGKTEIDCVDALHHAILAKLQSRDFECVCVLMLACVCLEMSFYVSLAVCSDKPCTLPSTQLSSIFGTHLG